MTATIVLWSPGEVNSAINLDLDEDVLFSVLIYTYIDLPGMQLIHTGWRWILTMTQQKPLCLVTSQFSLS